MYGQSNLWTSGVFKVAVVVQKIIAYENEENLLMLIYFVLSKTEFKRYTLLFEIIYNSGTIPQNIPAFPFMYLSIFHSLSSDRTTLYGLSCWQSC